MLIKTPIDPCTNQDRCSSVNPHGYGDHGGRRRFSGRSVHDGISTLKDDKNHDNQNDHSDIGNHRMSPNNMINNI